MDKLKEYSGVKTKGDQEVFDFHVPDGSEIHIKAIANFEGFKCRLWAPEFHGIMLDSAIKHSREAEILRKGLEYEYDSIYKLQELKDTRDNMANSFMVMQNAISSVALSISSVEAWANKTIHEKVKSQIEFERLDGSIVCWGGNRIEKDTTLTEKVFTIIPKLFGVEVVKKHVTVRKRFVELISERNTIIHLKNAPKVSGEKTPRNSLALMLLRRNSLQVPKNIISVFRLVYDKSNTEIPSWLAKNIGTLEGYQREVKNI
ncbi:MAG: hypothetical protein ABJK37_09160 [Paraglaciecola sp.]|uniref:hypothetical protein n=1 Tax=Paraglaciecola sp. TaxID=1920173 RepID=UPI00329785F7